MDLNDFRCMHRGLHLSVPTSDDLTFLNTLHFSNGKKESALILLHGFSSTPAVYRHFIPHFLKKYDTLIIPTLPGHASNLRAFENMKSTDLLQFVNALSAQFVNEYTHVDVMGLSLGGLLAAQIAAHYPLRHLYLLAPAFDLHLSLNNMLKLAQCLRMLGFRFIRNMAGNIKASDTYELAYRLLPLTTIIELLGFIQQINVALPQCPSDLFLATQDEIVDSAQVAARFLNASNVTTHWLSESAHVLPLDNNKDRIIQCVYDRLNS